MKATITLNGEGITIETEGATIVNKVGHYAYPPVVNQVWRNADGAGYDLVWTGNGGYELMPVGTLRRLTCHDIDSLGRALIEFADGGEG